MTDDILKMLEIARENVQINPNIFNQSPGEVARRYIQGIVDETQEVLSELRTDNQVYLTDELGDILWDYLTLLSVLEQHGLIENVEAVFSGAREKYTERAPALSANSADHWNEIKKMQKERLKKRHQERYKDRKE